MREPQAALLVVVLVALAGTSPAAPPDAAAPEAARSDEAAATVPLEIPEAASRRRNPVAAEPHSLERGQRLYSSQCSMCHGATGDGKGDVALRHGFAMPDFTDVAQQRRRTDGDLFYVLTQGHGHMPGDARLPEEWRWDIINHLRTLRPQDPEGEVKPGPPASGTRGAS
jgi:mono/diheme cytochrome c family protein